MTYLAAAAAAAGLVARLYLGCLIFKLKYSQTHVQYTGLEHQAQTLNFYTDKRCVRRVASLLIPTRILASGG